MLDTLVGMIGRLAKVIGVLGGVAAVVWAMRDRFISVATSREPEPPTFRATTPNGSTRSGLGAIDGIGPVFAGRLIAAGLDNVESLAKASPDSVAEAAGVSGARARAWIDQANNIS